jgi:hypothetical protein
MSEHRTQRTLLFLLLFYGAASLVHFIHNAEFIADYPNLPASWTRFGVYRAWIALTIIGLTGWFFLARGHRLTGLLVLAAYAMLGLSSLGHYVLAPLSEHSLAMNVTILFEVTAAALVLVEVLRQIGRTMLRSGSSRT